MLLFWVLRSFRSQTLACSGFRLKVCYGIDEMPKALSPFCVRGWCLWHGHECARALLSAPFRATRTLGVAFGARDEEEHARHALLQAAAPSSHIYTAAIAPHCAEPCKWLRLESGGVRGS